MIGTNTIQKITGSSGVFTPITVGGRGTLVRNASGATVYLHSAGSGTAADGYPLDDGESVPVTISQGGLWAVNPSGSLDLRVWRVD